MSANELALLRLGYRDACAERDALAQRCRELEDYIDNHSAVTADYIARLQRTLDERDALRAERDQLERIARYLARTYVVSDDDYDPETATDGAMARLKEQFA